MSTVNARKRTANARVHSFGLSVRFEVTVIWQQAEAARLDVAISANLRELGYDG